MTKKKKSSVKINLVLCKLAKPCLGIFGILGMHAVEL